MVDDLFEEVDKKYHNYAKLCDGGVGAVQYSPQMKEQDLDRLYYMAASVYGEMGIIYMYII